MTRFILSGLIAGGITVSLCYLLWSYYHANVLYGDDLHVIRTLIKDNIGDFNFFILIFLSLFISCFLIITNHYRKKCYITTLNNISKAITQISQGNFDIEIPVKSHNQIGNISKNINSSFHILKKAIESGEFAKRTKDKLVINIAHDLRTPLTSINGYLGLIINNKDLTKDKMEHYAQIAYNKSLRMERLIEQLFEFTKFNYGNKEVIKNKIDLCYLIKQIMEESWPMLNQNSLEGRLFLKERSAYIKADGDLIARVFDNIISNAIRHGEEGHYVDIELFREETEFVVHIINYDSLIPEEELPYIFETFYKIDKSRSSKTSGTGLGLAIAKNIIELHEGSISADSNFERTLFEIRLPSA